jgi:hypothetical protein
LITRGDYHIALEKEKQRYEVEIQLGATDPSHIIRSIEYWDIEKKRYPKYDHCAVIVAEEITGRFMNVISLFNGSIPLIALQMSAVKHGDEIELIFTKVLDRITLGSDEDDAVAEATDRNYWEKKASTPKTMKIVDMVFKDCMSVVPGYELKYNITAYWIVFASVKEYLYQKSLEIIAGGMDVILDWGFWTKEEHDGAR